VFRSFGGGTIALAPLVCGMVFAAVAGPAQDLHSRTQALTQTIAGFAVTTKTVRASVSVSSLSQDLSGVSSSAVPDITESALGTASQQIAAGLAAVPVPLSAGGWTGVTTNAQDISSGYGPLVIAKAPPQFVFNYRDTLAANSRLVAGSLTPGPGFPSSELAVTTTAATAARFGVHPGSRLIVDGNPIIVTGVIAPIRTSSAFWQYDVTAMVPVEITSWRRCRLVRSNGRSGWARYSPIPVRFRSWPRCSAPTAR
jgi:hypothetical protein